MNWRLMFSGTQSTSGMLGIAVLIIAAAAICYWLLRLECQLVSGRVAFALTGLRLLLIFCLLLIFLQPVITRPAASEHTRRLVVAVDISRSMETRDRHAAASESLRWAEALGMTGNAKHAELLSQWANALDEGREPDWLGTGKPPADEAEKKLEEGRRRQLQMIREEFAEMPRTEFVGRLLAESSSPLLHRLAAIAPIDLRLFTTVSFPVTQPDLESLLLPSPPKTSQTGGSDSPHESATDLLDTLASDPRETDFGPLLKSVINASSEAAASAPPPRGVILLTDGRQTMSSGSGLTTESQRLKALGIPVFCIPVGSRNSPRDLVIAAVDVPETVYLRDQAELTVVVGTAGFEGTEIVVRLMLDESVIDEKKFTPSDDQATLRFQIPAENVGRFQYALLTPIRPGELSDENNRREFTLEVSDNKAQVLLVESDPRWEFRYLKNLLERDPRVKLSSVLFRQPWMKLLNEPFIRSSLPAPDDLREALSETDVLILGDLRPEQLTDDALKVIEEAVSADGLSVLVIPGKDNFPHEFESELLRSLLPVSEVSPRRAEDFVRSDPDGSQSVFQLALTEEAEQLPIFRMTNSDAQVSSTASGDNGLTRKDFQNLPGHPWICTATPRASATVWARSSLKGSTAASEPVILHHYYGSGQVIWIGMDSTWRWRRRAGDQYHHRFWGQLIRWCARNKASRGNGDVTLSLSDSTIDTTESVDILTRWRESLLPQLKDQSIEAVFVRRGESPPAGKARQDSRRMRSEERVLRLKADSSHPERYSGRVNGLPAGQWSITLRTPNSPVQFSENISAELEVRQRPSGEMANVSCNRELLLQLASETGGAVIEPSEVDKLLTLIQPEEDQSVRGVEERTLQDHWSTLIVFFGLLSAEWIVRKLSGLP